MLMIFRDIYRFFSATYVLVTLLILTLVGLLLSLSHPDILPPVLFFGGVWYTKLLWFLFLFSVLMLFIKRVALFAQNATERGFLFAASKAITSIPLAVVLIGLIILLGLIQTFVPQHSFNREIDLVTRFGSENYALLDRMQIFDIFSSWYLYAVVGLFVVNLGACTVKRLGASIRYNRQRMKPKALDSFERMPQYHAISTHGIAPDIAFEKFRNALRSKGFGVRAEGDQLLAEKRRWERFSIDIFHIALIITILALAVSGLFGFNTILVQYSGNVFAVPERDFTVEVVDFDLENYSGTERVMDWWTKLNIIEDGELVKSCRIEVNHPCYHQGMGIYQAAMGDDWLGSANITFEVWKKDFTDNAPPIVLGEFQANVGSSFEIPEENLRVEFDTFLPDFQLHENTVFSKSQTLNNPAAYLEVSSIDGSKDPSKNYRTWTFKNAPSVQAELPQEYMFLITGMEASQFTGLELSADPGKGIAYLSFSIIMLTLMGHLLFNHQMVWVGFNAEDGKILIGGRARKGDFAEQFEQIASALEHSLHGASERAETGVVT